MFPCADIHHLLSPDLLHKLIKGTFKDHIVDWIEKYIESTHRKSQEVKILADIDRQCGIFSSRNIFVQYLSGTGLLQFHHSQGYVTFTKAVASSNGQGTTQRVS